MSWDSDHVGRRPSLAQVAELISAEIKELVLDDRTTRLTAQSGHVVPRRIFSLELERIQVIQAVQMPVLSIVPGLTMEFIGAVLGSDDELSGSGVPVFGREVVGQQGELFHGFGNNRCRLTGDT